MVWRSWNAINSVCIAFKHQLVIKSLNRVRFTIAGIKLLIIADPTHRSLDLVLRKLYEIYADYVLKNPFYQPEMPIRCELFDLQLNKEIQL